MHLVLRLRGGDWQLVVNLPNGNEMHINVPSETYPISDTCKNILRKYPKIKKEQIVLKCNNLILDHLKNLKDYNIFKGTHKV